MEQFKRHQTCEHRAPETSIIDGIQKDSVAQISASVNLHSRCTDF